MKIHVVSFQVPYPADYGGAIDVFNKLKAMKEIGYETTLHTYAYNGRGEEPILDELCEKVFYYPRHTGWKQQFSTLPYIVRTRDCRALLDNLCQDDSPILFEGIHTCFFLNHPRLANRRKIVRMHNIEHEYYGRLAEQSPCNWRSLFYRVESWRLKHFENRLCKAQLVCAITKADKQQLEHRLKNVEVIHLPCFFDTTFPERTGNTEPYVLYHGNLAVEENLRVMQYIVRHIAPLCSTTQFIIAGRNPICGMKLPDNVKIVGNPTDEQLDILLQRARIHLLLTFQPTGIKLKLLNALVRGQGHIIANHDMLYGHSLGRLCIRADEATDIAQKIQMLISQPLDVEKLKEREQIILKMKKAGISRLSLLNRY